MVVVASDLQLTDNAKLLFSFLESLRIPTILVRPHSFEGRVLQLMRAQSPLMPINLVILEDFLLYFTLPPSTKKLMDDYCRKNNVAFIVFFKSSNTLRELGDTPGFAVVDKTYPLLLRIFPHDATQPMGFYLSKESSILHIARGGQGDTQPLSKTQVHRGLWPCSRPSTKDHYPDLLANASAELEYFGGLLPTFLSVLRRQHEPNRVPSSCPPLWATFVPRDVRNFQPVAFTKTPSGDSVFSRSSCTFKQSASGVSGLLEDTEVYQSLVLEDVGIIDGIRRVLFSFEPTQHWSTALLFNDAVRHFVRKNSLLDSDPGSIRYVQIDIDDVFLAPIGSRMTAADVEALIAAQQRWREFIPGFMFHLGFVGKTYMKGTPLEQAGDAALVVEKLSSAYPLLETWQLITLLQMTENRHYFRWFCHTWNHSKPHLLSEAELYTELRANKEFAEKYALPIAEGYAVAPHHSGVYPVVPHLYRAWKHVWNISATSTEGYPHLLPPSRRRGFRLMDIQVLPRQTCGVFTTTISRDNYPGGIENLHATALGGELFQTLLFNPVNIYMTHFGNYATDRLAIYVFDLAFNFLQSWTKLQLKGAQSVHALIAHHLDFNPREQLLTSGACLPLQSDPCADHRHAAIWPASGCTPRGHRLPTALIVGPQKTGTTALLVFMALHPHLKPNHVLPKPPFEEIQFFSNDSIYSRGVAFYNDQFPIDVDDGSRAEPAIYFEKSASYFDSPYAPERAAALVPGAKIIIILREPMQRAFSWYQHERAHRSPAAELFTFDEVLQASRPDLAGQVVANAASKRPLLHGNHLQLEVELLKLYHKCVAGSTYSTHLQNWLVHFRAQNILLIDGERLETDPVSVMRDVQDFLKTNRTIDYSNLLTWNPEKGYFCVKGGPYPAVGALLKRIGGRSNQWCLPEGKGRRYNHSLENSLYGPFEIRNRELSTLLVEQPFWRPAYLNSSTNLLPHWLRF